MWKTQHASRSCFHLLSGCMSGCGRSVGSISRQPTTGDAWRVTLQLHFCSMCGLESMGRKLFGVTNYRDISNMLGQAQFRQLWSYELFSWPINANIYIHTYIHSHIYNHIYIFCIYIFYIILYPGRILFLLVSSGSNISHDVGSYIQSLVLRIMEHSPYVNWPQGWWMFMCAMYKYILYIYTDMYVYYIQWSFQMHFVDFPHRGVDSLGQKKLTEYLPLLAIAVTS